MNFHFVVWRERTANCWKIFTIERFFPALPGMLVSYPEHGTPSYLLQRSELSHLYPSLHPANHVFSHPQQGYLAVRHQHISKWAKRHDGDRCGMTAGFIRHWISWYVSILLFNANIKIFLLYCNGCWGRYDSVSGWCGADGSYQSHPLYVATYLIS